MEQRFTEQAAKLSQEQIAALLGIQEKYLDLEKRHLARIAELEQQVEWFKRQLFGRRSERRILAGGDSRQLSLGEMQKEEAVPPPTQTIKSYQRRQHRKQPWEGSVLEKGLRFDSSVPIEEIQIPNPAIAGLDESEYEIISEKVTHRLAQKPGSYVILRYVRKVVKLKKDQTLLCPPAPVSVLDKSYADVSFLAGLLIDKFRYHLPLYRQHQRLTDSGIRVSRSMLTGQVHQGLELLRPVFYSVVSSIVQSRVITMDETPIKVTHSREKHQMRTGYFWPIYGDQEEVAFLFSLSRGSPVVKEVLGSFGGVLVSDGYKVYDTYVKAMPGITHAQCWAHTRRKFEAAQNVEPQLSQKALDEIGKLYAVEEHIRKQRLSGQEKLTCRAEHAKPTVEAFFPWLRATFEKQVLLPSSPFTKAAHYALEREAALKVFLEDPDVPIDTNHIERQIRPVAIGRKNWLFCWTEVGAHYAGIANTLIASCRLQGIDPYTYLIDVLQRVETHPIREVHRLTPRLWKQEFAGTPLRSDADPRKGR